MIIGRCATRATRPNDIVVVWARSDWKLWTFGVFMLKLVSPFTRKFQPIVVDKSTLFRRRVVHMAMINDNVQDGSK